MNVLYFCGYKQHRARISLETIDDLLKFISNAAEHYQLRSVDIIFHGGEPLLMNKATFETICEKLLATPSVDIHFALQTNGILIDEDWISLFDKYDISLGVSLDGPKDINDKHRVDHNGKGTYLVALSGVEKLIQAESENRIRSFGLLCVIDPYEDPAKILQYFTRELNMNSVDFLLPMETHNTVKERDLKQLKKYLVQLFDIWVSEFKYNKITIRLFSEIVTALTKDLKELEKTEKDLKSFLMLGVSSNGDIGFDELRGLEGTTSNPNIKEHSLYTYVNSKEYNKLNSQLETLPNECACCIWRGVCKGGMGVGVAVTKHSKVNQFKNKTVLCDALRALFTHISNYLITSGFSIESLELRLNKLAEGMLVHDAEMIEVINL